MRTLIRSAAFALGLLPALALAQSSSFPQTIGPNSVLGRLGINAGPIQAIPFTVFTNNLPLPSGKIFIGSAGNFATPQTVSGDGTLSIGGLFTLATVNGNVGTFGSATRCVSVTNNAKGLTTAITDAVCTPAVGSITGLGAGIASALGISVGTAGSPVINGGALGTPASGVATNLTGTAAGLTAGNVTTNANLTGAVTSVGNASSLGSFTSAALAGALTNETGSGLAVFGTSPSITTPTGIVKGDVGLGNVANVDTSNAANISSGTLPAARTNGHMNGTATNDSGAAGEVREYIFSSTTTGTAISLTTLTAVNVTSISLTAGDWDVWGTIDTNTGGTTDITQVFAWISLVSATVPTPPNGGAVIVLNYPAGSHIGFNDHFPVGMTRISVPSTTTVFLGARMGFTVSTAAAYGFIGARRR